jgi:hypothetical protein
MRVRQDSSSSSSSATARLRKSLAGLTTDETKGGEGVCGLEDYSAATGSVYDLEVVSQDLIDKDYYFTLSKEGITICRDKVSQFTPLAQWERETLLFNKIINIRFFTLYKRWKAFTVWRRGL